VPDEEDDLPRDLAAELAELRERVDIQEALLDYTAKAYADRLTELEEATVESLDDRVDSTDDRVESLDGRVESLGESVESLDDRLDALDDRLKELEESGSSRDSGCLSLVVFAIALKVFWPWISAAFVWLWNAALTVLAFVVAALQHK
jgi:predicted nuclease with TOPRIM domain